MIQLKSEVKYYWVMILFLASAANIIASTQGHFFLNSNKSSPVLKKRISDYISPRLKKTNLLTRGRAFSCNYRAYDWNIKAKEATKGGFHLNNKTTAQHEDDSFPIFPATLKNESIPANLLRGKDIVLTPLLPSGDRAAISHNNEAGIIKGLSSTEYVPLDISKQTKLTFQFTDKNGYDGQNMKIYRGSIYEIDFPKNKTMYLTITGEHPNYIIYPETGFANGAVGVTDACILKDKNVISATDIPLRKIREGEGPAQVNLSVRAGVT